MTSDDPAPPRRARKPAVVLVAHGAPGIAVAGSPLDGLAEQLRARGDLGAVALAHVHGAPSLPDALAACDDATPVCVVPLFAAEGHHTRVVLRGLLDAARAAHPRRVLRQAPALGTVPGYTQALAARVRRLVREAGLATARTAFLAIGHGQRRTPAPPDDAAQRLAAALHRDFAASLALYLDGEPSAASWATRVGDSDVLVAPLFFSDAQHARIDVPRLFGRAPFESGIPEGIDDSVTCAGRRVRFLGLTLADAAVAGIVASLALASDEATGAAA